jgi:hypothetical protein
MSTLMVNIGLEGCWDHEYMGKLQPALFLEFPPFLISAILFRFSGIKYFGIHALRGPPGASRRKKEWNPPLDGTHNGQNTQPALLKIS